MLVHNSRGSGSILLSIGILHASILLRGSLLLRYYIDTLLDICYCPCLVFQIFKNGWRSANSCRHWSGNILNAHSSASNIRQIKNDLNVASMLVIWCLSNFSHVLRTLQCPIQLQALILLFWAFSCQQQNQCSGI